MQLNMIKDILTFAAFRPEPDDSSASWSARFPKKPTVVVNINKNDVSWTAFGKEGEILQQETEEGTFADAVASKGEWWGDITHNGWIVLSINNRFMISLQKNLSRKKGYQEQLKTNPKAVLGSMYERGKKYALEHHPSTNSSLLVSCEEGLIQEIEEIARHAELKVGRISCGLFSLMLDALQENVGGLPPASEGQPPANSYLMVTCFGSSVCALRVKDGHWSEVRSRCGLYTDEDISPVVDIVATMLGSSGEGEEVFLIAEKRGNEIAAQLVERCPGLAGRLGEPERFWRVLREN